MLWLHGLMELPSGEHWLTVSVHLKMLGYTKKENNVQGIHNARKTTKVQKL